MKKLNRPIFTIAILFNITAQLLGDSNNDEFKLQFNDFYDAFQTKEIRLLHRYINDSSKFGFGGEYGITGFTEVYLENDHCYNELLHALRQGCKLSESSGETACFSPPQSIDTLIIYPGSRAKFSLINQQLFIDFAVCGAD